jgi:hypothetical protein
MKIRYFLLGVLFSALVIGMTSCYTNDKKRLSDSGDHRKEPLC